MHPDAHCRLARAALTLLTAALTGADTQVEVQKGKPVSRIEDVNGDGRLDLVLSFGIQQLIANGDLTSSTRSLAIRGVQSAGGDSCISFRGVGAVRVVS